jgi:hypothetical protein
MTQMTPEQRLLYADLTKCQKGIHFVNWPGARAWNNNCRGCRQTSQNANNMNRWHRDLRKRIQRNQGRLSGLEAELATLLTEAFSRLHPPSD